MSEEPNTTPQQRPERRRAPLPKAAVDVLTVLTAVVVGLAVASAVVSQPMSVGPLKASAHVAFGWPGRTELRLPPFGQVSADTHVGPARLVVTVTSIDVPAFERLLAERRSNGETTAAPSVTAQARSAGGSVSDIITKERRMAGREIAQLTVAVAMVAAAVAALVALVLARRFRPVWIAALLAIGIVLGSAALANATLNPRAFAEPRLEGALVYVPKLSTVFSARLDTIERLRAQASDVAEKLAAYYADPRSIAAGGGLPGTFRVLHVTDAHLDPVGIELAQSLARSYDASLVVNTGDLSISGGAPEAGIMASYVVSGSPNIIIPGNHDASPTVAALRRVPDATVLTSGAVEVRGLRIFAVGDPLGEVAAVDPDQGAVDEVTAAAADALRAAEASGETTPDIVALHNPGPERDFEGLTPLVLDGHTHTPSLRRRGGTVYLNSGTVGGMPYDTQIARGGRRRPHSASILYYTAELPRRLIAIDIVSVSADRTTSLTRHVIDESLLP